MAKAKDITRALIHVEGKRKRVWIGAEEIIAMAKTSVAPESVAKEVSINSEEGQVEIMHTGQIYENQIQTF